MCFIVKSVKKSMALFTLETDNPSETGYPLDNSRETDITS